ncbi:glutamate receptor 3-like [Corticium candelabrum]|uniref:glutamate receptor 3-like n=1 Tax=Corticium candelabrum TaxID=121492 RepID=UPI002E26867C|nr:glutamate receptor 3-like [Corticium candelabrum]
MVRQIANESDWKSIAYISDERWDFQLLNGLAQSDSRVKVSTIIQQTENLNFKKEASRILSLSIDAVVVHCQNASCFNAAKQIYMLVSNRSAAPWLFTNGFYQHVFASDLQSRTSGDMTTRALLLGIERTVLRSHVTAALMNFQDLLTAKPSKSDLFDLYDGIIVMAHLLHSIEFREVSILQRVNMLNIRGASGPVQFETSSGGRIGGVYEVVCMNPFTYSVLTIGTYDLNHSEWLHKLSSLLPLHQPTRHNREAEETITNTTCPPVSNNTRHFRVTTVPAPPFIMKDVNGTSGETRNGIFYGFLVDMMELLTAPDMLNFSYTMTEVSDGFYGSIDPKTNKPTGMVETLINCKADLAVAAFTITALRETHISFTKPFMNSGFVMLATKSTSTEGGLWSFLDPFHFWIWICILVSFFVCGACLIVLHRVSPYGRRTVDHPEDLPYTFNLHNSVWYFYSTFMQQGPEAAAFLSGKVLLAGWFFFCLIVVSTYTANLAAFLTVKNSPNSIESIDELSRQTMVKYGVAKHTAVSEFFKLSTITTYHRMNNYMRATDGVVMNTTQDGINRVKNGIPGEYIFIGSKPLLDFTSSQEPCTSKVVGDTFNRGNLGIAMPKGMPYLKNFSIAILKLKDMGKLEALERKWLKSGPCSQQSDDDESDNQAVKIQQMAGVFLLLIIAILLSLVVAIVERYVWKYKTTKRQRLGSEIIMETRHVRDSNPSQNNIRVNGNQTVQ